MTRTYQIDVEGEHVVPRTDAPIGVDVSCARLDNHEQHAWLWVSGHSAVDFTCPGRTNGYTARQQQEIARKAHLKRVRQQRNAAQAKRRTRRR